MTIPVRQCIRQVQRGDLDGIADICEAYEPLINSMSRRFCYLFGNIGEARSEAICAIIKSIYEYDLSGTTTVVEVMIAGVHNNFRSKAYRFQQENKNVDRLLHGPDGATDIPDHLVDTQAVLPEEHVIRQEQYAQLRAALATLEEKERILVRLRIQEGWTFRAISEAYGIPIPSIQIIVNRAIRKLRIIYGVPTNM